MKKSCGFGSSNELNFNAKNEYNQRKYIVITELINKLYSFLIFKGLCEWSVPQGGLFLWMKAKGISDTWDMLMQKGLKKNVMVVPGRAFATDPQSKLNSGYIRLEYLLITKPNLFMKCYNLSDLYNSSKTLRISKMVLS